MSDEGEIVSESGHSEDLVPGNGNDKSLQQIITGVVENLMTEKFADFKNEINDSVQATINKSLAEFRAQDAPARQESVLHSREENIHPKTDVAGTSSNGKLSCMQKRADNEEQSGSRMSDKEGNDAENPIIASAEGTNGSTSQEMMEQNLKRIIKSLLVDVKSELTKEIHDEVHKNMNAALLENRNEAKSESDFNKEIMEQDSDNDSNADNRIETSTGEDDSTVYSIHYWRKMAKDELKSARQTDLRSLTGIHTVICLDTSESMREPKAWSRAKQFYMEYLDGLQNLNKGDKRLDKVALVTFGKVTKVCRRYTSDYDSLKAEFDTLEPDGPSPMFGGLVLSKAVAETSDKRYPNADVEIWPKIILITDGRPTDVNNISGLEASDDNNIQKTKKLIYNEVSRLKDARIEMHIVYVGAADFEFLHILRECIDGNMMPHTDGEKMAQYYFIKIFMKRSKESMLAGGAADKVKSALDEIREQFENSMLEQLKSLAELTKNMADMLKNTYDKYQTVDDKRYPAIGSRVRRWKDWSWGDQDDHGVGTIIGHYPKGPEERQIWIWVEWDENEDANIYRYKTLPGTKGDVKIVDEDRLPPADRPIAVGMKVSSGKDFQGKAQPSKGVVIKLIFPDGSDDSSKAEVLWSDGTRGQYYFGEDGTKAEIEPRTVFDKPDKPRHLTIRSVSDKAVCLKWEKPKSSGGCSILKYSVFRKTDHEDSEWTHTVDVDGSQTSATVSVLLLKEKYKFAVRAENKIGYGLFTEMEKTIMLELKVNRPQPPAGPLRFIKITKSSCTVSWKESQEVAPVSHYLLEFRETNGQWDSINVGLETSYTMCKLKKSTKYEVQVKAVNNSGESEPLEIHTFFTMTILDNDIQDAELQDTDIAELSQGIGKNWPMLGPHFERTNVEIDHIQDDHRLGVAMQINAMLSNWKNDKGRDATLHKFLEGIEKFKGSVVVNWPIIEQVTRRFQTEA